ncbi:2-amino-4-hydroxy-6-hydroxymethyldihydropteridine diphosphokinase [Rhodoferax sediminis]|uniref:2-amino-4-hydroxy-6-hydroxymethyldihydropteridine pyrophosphokinase n=1 Tax=Rhodoferax sediminis TaxID=2509614 RepID=A0A515D944_9BURK|nr:2-amino-4-hydroxy-6-hydroxymethyldihydropteridine diphosphokinase [Rhodoferax sediminis]QDL36941.1 2-amino-4-hydroxy-6-hydroxymethyldihydropteridine diphosphokinase [Rhodoferax sediminis]
MKTERVTAYIALGANLGDAVATISGAMNALATLPDTQLTRRSSLYRTAPIDAGGPDYINAVVEVSTALPAPLLLLQLQRLEQGAGRERSYRNAPRTLDLDLLLYGEAQLQGPALTIPHPRMAARAFVLVPLAEIAPQRVSAAQLRRVSTQTIRRL